MNRKFKEWPNYINTIIIFRPKDSQNKRAYLIYKQTGKEKEKEGKEGRRDGRRERMRKAVFTSW